MNKPSTRGKAKRSSVQASSGNVFADLGLADADERHTKVHLAFAIREEIAARGYSQVEAAEVLGVNQPKVSALLKYRLEGFSVERLMHFLTALGHDVEIIIKPRNARRPGRILVESFADAALES